MILILILWGPLVCFCLRTILASIQRFWLKKGTSFQKLITLLLSSSTQVWKGKDNQYCKGTCLWMHSLPFKSQKDNCFLECLRHGNYIFTHKDGWTWDGFVAENPQRITVFYISHAHVIEMFRVDIDLRCVRVFKSTQYQFLAQIPSGVTAVFSPLTRIG